MVQARGKKETKAVPVMLYLFQDTAGAGKM